MTYSASSLIIDDDYNIFAAGNADGTANLAQPNINAIWGTGGGNLGYGQSTTVANVSAGTTVTATQWSSLFSRFTDIAAHQGSTVTAVTNPVATDLIEVKTNFVSNLTTIFNNRANAVASGSDITANGTTTTTGTWDVSAVLTQTITFANADSARYFFNAGGMIRLSCARSGGTSSDKNSEWTDLLDKSGTIVLTGVGASKSIASVNFTGTTKIGGSGAVDTLTTATGFYNLTTNPTTIFKQFADSSPYTSNFKQITAQVNDNANPTTITFVTTLSDAAEDTVSPTDDAGVTNLDIVDGTLTATHVIRPPSTSNLNSASWGTPSMNSVSWVLTS